MGRAGRPSPQRSWGPRAIPRPLRLMTIVEQAQTRPSPLSDGLHDLFPGSEQRRQQCSHALWSQRMPSAFECYRARSSAFWIEQRTTDTPHARTELFAIRSCSFSKKPNN